MVLPFYPEGKGNIKERRKISTNSQQLRASTTQFNSQNPSNSCPFTYLYAYILFLCTEKNNTHERIFELVVDKLSATYRGHIVSAEKREWIFINCGGWMGSFQVLHASITEYVILFGTAIHTSGNSGKDMHAHEKLQHPSRHF